MGRCRRSRRRGSVGKQLLPIDGEVPAQPAEGLCRKATPPHSWGGAGAAGGGAEVDNLGQATMGRRVLTSVGIVVGLIAASFVAAAAYTALKSPLQTKPNSNLAPDNCSPGPCANVNGYKIWISKVRIENDVVRMTVKFQNS